MIFKRKEQNKYFKWYEMKNGAAWSRLQDGYYLCQVTYPRNVGIELMVLRFNEDTYRFIDERLDESSRYYDMTNYIDAYMRIKEFKPMPNKI